MRSTASPKCKMERGTQQIYDALSLTDSTRFQPKHSLKSATLRVCPGVGHQLTGADAAFAAVAFAGAVLAVVVVPPVERMDSVSVSTFFIIG